MQLMLFAQRASVLWASAQLVAGAQHSKLAAAPLAHPLLPVLDQVGLSPVSLGAKDAGGNQRQQGGPAGDARRQVPAWAGGRLWGPDQAATAGGAV